MAKLMILIDVDQSYDALKDAMVNQKNVDNISFKVPGQVIVPKRYVEDRAASANKYSFEVLGIRP